MAIDSIVEKLVEEYEEKREQSRLYHVVDFAIKSFQNEWSHNAQTSIYLSELGYLFGRGHIPYRYMFEYLSWRIPEIQESNEYYELKASMIVNELEALWYVSGMLPLVVNKETGEKKLLENPEDYEYLRPFRLGVTETERRHDTRAFRLYRRVTEVNRASNGPNWTSLLNIVLSFPLLIKDKRLGASYEEIVGQGTHFEFDKYIENSLRDYLTGQKAIVINEKGDEKTIQPLANLELLMTSNIRKGHDRELSQLFAEVRYRTKTNVGWPWGTYLDRVGKTDESIAYHGMPVGSRMISGRWNEEDDYAYLKAIALGRIPVIYKGEEIRVASKEDTYVFIGYKKPFRTPDKSPEQLIPVFKRAKVRYEHGTQRKPEGEGRTPAQLLQRVLQDPEVVSAIGEVFLEDIENQWYLSHFKYEIRSRLLGQTTMRVRGRDRRVRPLENLPLLMPESPNADGTLHKLNKQIRWHKGKTGLVYYDFIDLVGAEPEVMSYHRSTRITRELINPMLT